MLSAIENNWVLDILATWFFLVVFELLHKPCECCQQVKAFRLDPAGRYGSDTQGGYVDLDGEILARGKGSMGDSSRDPMVYGPRIEVTMQKGLATLFCPP